MFYLDDLTKIVERSELFRGKKVHLTVIANPVAGGFTIKKKVDENVAMLKRSLSSVENRPVVTSSCSSVLHMTNSAGHAKNLARSVLEIAASDATPSTIYLIITAGGDGTSLEVQCELAVKILEEKNQQLSDRVCILRLPFGTGNDGSDGRRLDESLVLLTEKSHFEKQSAILVYSARHPEKVSYSFNIASIGIDAFVTHMTNRVKNLFPGDFYKIWVDLACVFLRWQNDH